MRYITFLRQHPGSKSATVRDVVHVALSGGEHYEIEPGTGHLTDGDILVMVVGVTDDPGGVPKELQPDGQAVFMTTEEVDRLPVAHNYASAVGLARML